MGLTPPNAGTTTEASGVSQTTADATTVINRVPKIAIHHSRSPRRCTPRDRQPCLERPSRVTTNNMMTVARAGVLDHTISARGGVSPSALIDNAAVTAKTSTSTVKTAAFCRSESLVNMNTSDTS